MIEQAVAQLADELIGDTADPYQWDRAQLETEFLLKFLLSVPDVTDAARVKSRDDLVRAAQQAGREAFQAKLDYFKEIESKIGAANLGGQLLSQLMLRVIDDKWKDHLYDLDQLRVGIQFRQWGQKDPLIEYKHEAYEMFVGLMHDLRATFAEQWLKLQLDVAPPPGQPARVPTRTVTGPAGGRPGRRATPMVATKAAADGLVNSEARAPAGAGVGVGVGVGPTLPAANPYAGVGRNDPCPCGSGKKFKKCHGAAL
jgi:preprotein translocase subunit SecA